MDNKNNFDDIKVLDVKSGISAHGDIQVKINDLPEVLLAAHNSNPNAHKNLLGKLIEKTEALTIAVDELQDNLVLADDVPTKISELENDLNFVSEESLVEALEKRQIVNLETLKENLDNRDSVIQNNITLNVNTLSSRIEEIETNIAFATDPETISSYSMPSDKYIALTAGASGASYTMPANGMIYCLVKCNATNAWFNVKRSLTGSRHQIPIGVVNSHAAVEMPVSKGEIIEITYTSSTIATLGFLYLNGNAPKDEDGGEN